MDFENELTQAQYRQSPKKTKAYRFDIFKGYTDEQDRIQKICSVGHSTLFEGSATYCIYLKTFLKDQFYLLPEQQFGRSYDYVILTREPSNIPGKKYFWNRVGTAKVLSGKNSGIMQLEFDLFGDVGLYLSFHDSITKEQEIDNSPAA